MPRSSSILQLCTHSEDTASIAAISPQTQTYFISVHSPNLILFWKLGKTGPAARLEGHNSAVSAIAFGFEETIIASGSEAGTVMLWDIAGQRALSSLKGNRSAVTSLSLGQEGASGLVAVAGADGLVRLWDSRGKDPATTITQYPSAATCIKFSPSSEWVACSSSDGTVSLWDINTQSIFQEFTLGTSARMIAFSPQQTMIACAGFNCSIKTWSLNSFECLLEGKMGSGQLQGAGFDLEEKCLFTATKTEVYATDTQAWTCEKVEEGLREVMEICPSVTGVVSISAIENRVEVWTTDVSSLIAAEQQAHHDDIATREQVPSTSDAEDQLKALSDVSSTHNTYMDLFRKKKDSLNTVLQWWTDSNVNATIGSLSMMKDVPVSADVLKAWIVDSCGEKVVLEHLPLLLPLCLKLIESRYESFIRVGLGATQTLVEKFDSVLMNGLQDGAQREDLYRKCEEEQGIAYAGRDASKETRRSAGNARMGMQAQTYGRVITIGSVVPVSYAD